MKLIAKGSETQKEFHGLMGDIIQSQATIESPDLDETVHWIFTSLNISLNGKGVVTGTLYDKDDNVVQEKVVRTLSGNSAGVEFNFLLEGSNNIGSVTSPIQEDQIVSIFRGIGPNKYSSFKIVLSIQGKVDFSQVIQLINWKTNSSPNRAYHALIEGNGVGQYEFRYEIV